MSHDIRTPINAIVGMTEIAARHSENPEYVRECLRKVKVSSQYLLDIINNVLDMSRIEAGKFTLSEDVLELPRLVYGVITILNQSMTVKSQRLVARVENVRNERVIGDVVRLTQVFVNIISNSVKFTPNGGTITLEIKQTDCDEEGWGSYVFTFSDTGIGMSPEFIGRIFDTFTRDENTSVAVIEGTGLGMAIAKSFVEMMNGKITCESNPGLGTTFTISLRMKLAEDKAAEEKNTYKDTAVLVVGNENQAEIFGGLGARADSARDYPTAAAMAGAFGYSFVIINPSDDDRSGVAAVRLIKEASLAKDAAFVLVSGDLFSVDRAAAEAVGTAAVIQAPLFGSTARGILNRTYEHEKLSDADETIRLDGMRVLVVEDNRINREIACDLIADAGAETVEAQDGREAVDAFISHEPRFFDIILMDVQMPVMNGYEATAAIRSLQGEDAAEIPIYAMTANTFDEDVRQVREAGMNGHLGKPYEAAELFRIIARFKNN